MVNHCSNPTCNKPLHYLREGRIYVFDVIDPKSQALPNGRYPHHMEHFWLCGRCSETLLLEQTAEGGIRVLPTAAQERRPQASVSPGSASNVVLVS
jgi:hypothetical protein